MKSKDYKHLIDFEDDLIAEHEKKKAEKKLRKRRLRELNRRAQKIKGWRKGEKR
jgi:hypothetical protein